MLGAREAGRNSWLRGSRQTGDEREVLGGPLYQNLDEPLRGATGRIVLANFGLNVVANFGTNRRTNIFTDRCVGIRVNFGTDGFAERRRFSERRISGRTTSALGTSGRTGTAEKGSRRKTFEGILGEEVFGRRTG